VAQPPLVLATMTKVKLIHADQADQSDRRRSGSLLFLTAQGEMVLARAIQKQMPFNESWLALFENRTSVSSSAVAVTVTQ
jgi:hypothetical protein